jgi:hypothetical protein
MRKTKFDQGGFFLATLYYGKACCAQPPISHFSRSFYVEVNTHFGDSVREHIPAQNPNKQTHLLHTGNLIFTLAKYLHLSTVLYISDKEMRPIFLNLVLIVLSCGGEDEGGEREERFKLLISNFSRRKREIADAIVILVEDVIQAEEESLSKMPGTDASQNTSNSQFQDISWRIKEEVSIEVLLEKDLSKQKRMFSPGRRTTFGRNKRDPVKAKQVELSEQVEIQKRSVKENTSKKEDKFVVHEPISIPEDEEDNTSILIKAMVDEDLSIKKRMFSPGRRTNFGRKRRDIFTTVRDQTFGQEHVPVKAESSGQIKRTPEKKSKLKVKAHDALGFAKDQPRTQVSEAPAEKDLSRKKQMFSPGRKTNFGRKRRYIFGKFKEEVWQPKVQIDEENSRQESRNIPHMGKIEELSTLKTDSVPDRHEQIFPHRFSPFRGIFLFPFNAGFADFGRQLIISPTTSRPPTTTSPPSSPTPQEVSPVHIMECSGTSSSSCYNRLCTVQCSGGNKVNFCVLLSSTLL